MRQVGSFAYIDLPEDMYSLSLSKELQDLMAILLERQYENIVINGEHVREIGTVGLGALLSIQKICMLNGAEVKVCNLRPEVADEVRQSRMNHLILTSKEDSDLDLFYEPRYKLATS